jgi:hypothetical protein
MTRWHLRTDDGNTACRRGGDLTVDRGDFYRRVNSDRCQRCERADKTATVPAVSAVPIPATIKPATPAFER